MKGPSMGVKHSRRLGRVGRGSEVPCVARVVFGSLVSGRVPAWCEWERRGRMQGAMVCCVA